MDNASDLSDQPASPAQPTTLKSPMAPPQQSTREDPNAQTGSGAIETSDFVAEPNMSEVPQAATQLKQVRQTNPQTQEGAAMQKSGSRIPAPTVESVTSGDVRYEQIKNGLLAGFDQMGGLLAAYDAQSGKQLWTLKVYENKRNPEREGDVQDIFFKSMTLQADGKLLIENERGARFVVDPKHKTVTPES